MLKVSDFHKHYQYLQIDHSLLKTFLSGVGLDLIAVLRAQNCYRLLFCLQNGFGMTSRSVNGKTRGIYSN